MTKDALPPDLAFACPVSACCGADQAFGCETLSGDMAALLRLVEAETAHLPEFTDLPPAQGRALVEQCDRRWNGNLPAVRRADAVVFPPDVECGTDARAGMVFEPPQATPGAILYLHGGGWAFCSITTHERLMRLLALEAGMSVIAVDYRLAPEFPFPAGLKDCIAAWRSLLADPRAFGLRPGPLLVAGDSAGANLALALMLHELNADRRPPDGALLLYGVYDHEFQTCSHRQFGTGYGLTTQRMRHYWDWYAREPATRADPLASPLRASDSLLRRLPPLFLAAATLDCLRCDTLRLEHRLRALERSDICRVFPDVVHGFLQMTEFLDTARATMAVVGGNCRAMAGHI